MTCSGETLLWAEHTYYTQIMINWFFIYSFVEKFNFLIYKLFILGLQSYCLFCKAELILKIVETHIDEWQPWDLANNECLVTIFCIPIQSIIRNKTNNKSMYGNIVGVSTCYPPTKQQPDLINCPAQTVELRWL